jgi:hypothetical protein
MFGYTEHLIRVDELGNVVEVLGFVSLSSKGPHSGLIRSLITRTGRAASSALTRPSNPSILPRIEASVCHHKTQNSWRVFRAHPFQDDFLREASYLTR